MTTNSPPSRNPAGNNSMIGMIDFVLTKFLQGMDDMLPAQVIAYNRASNRAQVQAVISMTTTDAQIVSRAQIASVPVFRFGGGGFASSFPLATGDTGWIKANDRDISLWKQSSKATKPNTQRMHSFSDAMFFPDAMLADLVIAAEDVNNAVWQNLAGTVKIALWPTFIKIMATAGVGIGGSPNAHALLDLQSTTQAFIPPRMTTGQRNAIPSPVEGMIIWNTTTHALSSYNGTSWS